MMALYVVSSVQLLYSLSPSLPHPPYSLSPSPPSLSSLPSLPSFLSPPSLSVSHLQSTLQSKLEQSMRSAQDRDREQEQKIGVLEGRTEELKSSAESLQRECEELRAALKEKEVTRAAANSRVEMLSAELSTKVSGGGWSAKDERWIEEGILHLLCEMQCSPPLLCHGVHRLLPNLICRGHAADSVTSHCKMHWALRPWSAA